MLLFSEWKWDLHQSRLLQCSRYVWSNLSSTLIWCAWGVLTTHSDILPAEKLLHSYSIRIADSLCKRNGDYCSSLCLQIHTLPYRGWVYGCPLDFAGSYHTTKAIGSTCLFYINLQLPAQDMKEFALSICSVSEDIRFVCVLKSGFCSSLVACSTQSLT